MPPWLKPWARAVVTAWVLVTVPLLVFSLATMVLTLPRVVGTAWDNGGKQQAALAHSLASGDLIDAAVRVLALICIALPVAGIFYILVRLGRQLITGLWQKTRGKAWQRGVAMAAIAAVTAGLAWAWWPGAETYRPVQPYERGTLADATTTIFPTAAGHDLKQGQAGRTVALWPQGARKPTREEPQLSMVLVPRASSATPAASGTPAPAPSWVFPFDKPAAPEDGGNQALAVNTKDGSVVYDVAFALVWADDGEDVRNTNEAYAFASCKDCAAVAVGFQVVLIVGQTNVVVPENLSAAANYNCVRCLTYALANQLVLTLDGPLSADGTAKLNALWQQISEYGRNLQNVPLSEIQGKLEGFKQQIMDIVQTDPSASPRGAGTPAPTSSASPGATQTAAPSSTADPGSGATSPATGETVAPVPGAPTPAPYPTTGSGQSTDGATAPAPGPTASSPALETAAPAPAGTTAPTP